MQKGAVFVISKVALLVCLMQKGKEKHKKIC